MWETTIVPAARFFSIQSPVLGPATQTLSRFSLPPGGGRGFQLHRRSGAPVRDNTPRMTCSATRERLLHEAPSSSKAGAQPPSGVRAVAAPLQLIFLLVPSQLSRNASAVASPAEFLKLLASLWQTGRPALGAQESTAGCHKRSCTMKRKALSHALPTCLGLWTHNL